MDNKYPLPNEDYVYEEKSLPSAFVTMRGPVDGKRDPYFYAFDFDLADPNAYAELATKYEKAWKAYYSTESDPPSYTAENAIKLRDAIKFWFYMDDGSTETINVEGDDNGGGIIDKPEEAFTHSPRYSQEYYGDPDDPDAVSRWEVAYDDPNAVYDEEVYNKVTNDGANPLPMKTATGDLVIGASRPNVADGVYSAKQAAMTERETTRTAPESAYDWGGSYASSGRTY